MSDDDSYEIPLQDQRVFGAGIKRKRVKFVPSTSSTGTAPPNTKQNAKSISDLYLSLVLPKEASPTEVSAQTSPKSSSISQVSSEGNRASEDSTDGPGLCDICRLPLVSSDDMKIATVTRRSSTDTIQPNQHQPPRPRPHEASLAHQVCLTHSHPPSHLDRNRKGLTYLSAYGWDPDARLGLGAKGQGIQYPIKAKAKDDKMGIGVVLPEERERLKKRKLEKLDAGKVRKLYETDKRKGERLREMFYRNDDVERYLGKG